MIEIFRSVQERYRASQRARIEAGLLRDEERLRESVSVLPIFIGYDVRIPEVARRMRGEKSPGSRREKEILFEAFAELFIPETSADNVETLRTIYGRGSYLLFEQQSLRALADELNMPWLECLSLYRKAAGIVSDSQLQRAKAELTEEL